MAADKGVRVVRIDTREPIDMADGRKFVITDFLSAEIAMKHPEVIALRNEAALARAGMQARPSASLSRGELEEQLASAHETIRALRAEVATLLAGTSSSIMDAT